MSLPSQGDTGESLSPIAGAPSSPDITGLARLLAGQRVRQIMALGRARTTRHSLITFGGSVTSMFVSIAATILISRALGPSTFGVLAVYTSLVQVLLGLTDFGLGTTAVKVISENLERNRPYAFAAMKVIIKLEVLSGLLVGTVGLAFSAQIASMLGGSHLLFVTRAAFIASIFSSAGAFVSPFFVAYQQFVKNALFTICNSLVRLAGVVLLSRFGAIQLHNVVVLYVGLAIGAFWVGLLLVPRDYARPSAKGEQRAALHEVLHFSKWILLSYFATVIAGRLDIFLLLHFKGPTDVGLYAAAQQLTSIMPVLLGAFTTVLLPRVSRMSTRGEFRGYSRKVVFGSTVLLVVLLPALGFGRLLVEAVFGSKYSGALTAFQLLFIGYLAPLFVNPISLVLYSVNKPRFLTFVNYGSLACSTIINLILIPRFGTTGAALTFAITGMISALAISTYTWREISLQPTSRASNIDTSNLGGQR